MDCCGSSKPEETDKETKKEQTGNKQNPVEKEHNHGGGCCGGGHQRYVAAHCADGRHSFSSIIFYQWIKHKYETKDSL